MSKQWRPDYNAEARTHEARWERTRWLIWTRSAIKELDELRIKEMNPQAREAYAKSIAKFEGVVDAMMWKCKVLPEWRDRISELFPERV